MISITNENLDLITKINNDPGFSGNLKVFTVTKETDALTESTREAVKLIEKKLAFSKDLKSL